MTTPAFNASAFSEAFFTEEVELAPATGAFNPTAFNTSAFDTAESAGGLAGPAFNSAAFSDGFYTATDPAFAATAFSDAFFIGEQQKKLSGRVRRRKGRAWNYDRAFAKREAERLVSEPWPLPPVPAPKPQPFVSLFETYQPAVAVASKPTRPHWRIEDYQAALASKRAIQEFERRQQDLDDEDVLLLLEAA